MSQQAVATALGITASAVGQWETGKTKPSWQMAQKLAELFSLPVDDDAARRRDVRLRDGMSALVEVVTVMLGDAVFDELQERDELLRSLDAVREAAAQA